MGKFITYRTLIDRQLCMIIFIYTRSFMQYICQYHWCVFQGFEQFKFVGPWGNAFCQKTFSLWGVQIAIYMYVTQNWGTMHNIYANDIDIQFLPSIILPIKPLHIHFVEKILLSHQVAVKWVHLGTPIHFQTNRYDPSVSSNKLWYG